MSDIVHNLMIKTHIPTGLKYLCYSIQSGASLKKYRGSGIRWKNTLKKYKAKLTDIDTNYVLVTEDYELLKETAIKLSIEFNVVESDEWANLKIECGDGGSTSTGKKWVTNGLEDLYIMKTDLVPDGYRYGRSKCIFNDKEKQKEFSSRADRIKAAASTKRFHQKRREEGKPWLQWVAKKGGENPAAKRIITPDGEFGSIEDARKFHNLTVYRIYKNIEKYPEQWKVL